MVEVPGLVPDPGPRPMGFPAELIRGSDQKAKML